MSDRARRIVDLSPEKLDLLLQQARKKKQAAASASIHPRASDASNLPLSFAQQRLWFLDQFVPDNAVYSIPQAVRLRGALDVAVLEHSINAVIARHQTLRVNIATHDGQPVQQALPALVVSLDVIDLAHLPEPQREAELERRITNEARRPIAMAVDPLIRATLLRLRENEHVLLLTLHHIIADSWSLGVLVRELATFYESFAQQHLSPLPPLPIQYADYAAWQREWLQGDVLEAQLTYWAKQLDSANVALALPTDHARPPIQTFQGASQTFVLSRALSEAVYAFGRREEQTLFMVLLAAFDVLLARYSGQEDVLVGTPIANRTRSEVEGLIGLFANTLVLRSDLSGNPTFRELLGRVRATCLDAYAHQDLPFEQLVEKLRPERDPSRNPLFQVMFVLQNTPAAPLELPGLTLLPLAADSGTAKFDLRLSITENAQELACVFEYNTDLFEPGTIQRMISFFDVLLADVVAHPERRLSEHMRLPAAEQQQLHEWNATAVPYQLAQSLHGLVAAQTVRTPDAVAVVFDGSSADAPNTPQLTYAELDQRAERIARSLCAQGVGRDTPVGMCAERSLDMVIGMLAILKAGGAYMPLDPTYPAERLAFILADAHPPVLLVQQHLVDRLPAHQATQLILDGAWPDDLSERQPRATHPDQIAYVLYTSGSTGTPKGVAVSHRSIVNRLLWMQSAYQLDATDRVLQKTPYSFDVSVWEFFWTLSYGARLVVARPEGHKDPDYLADLIARAQITTLHFVPSMLGAFLDVPDLSACDSIQRVICSGEALPLAFQQRFFARLDAALYNLYGPTEAAVDVTAWTCERDSRRASVPIGRPIANTQMYVLDQQLQPVPIGVRGELYIGGVQLARGYLHRPDLTAERFVPHPLAGRDPQVAPGARVYRTGDLARFAPDGSIEYLGRIDDQVKLRGFRIELGEIEATLRQHASVSEAVTLVREDEPGQRRLVAYVLPDTSAGTKAGQLADELRDEQVQSWQAIFDTTYAQPAPQTDAFNLVGWNSSFSGAPLPETAMHEWVAQTVARIRALGPQRVLELGCGTGLLLLRLAPECSAYVGTDLSATVLDGLTAQVRQRDLEHVTLLQQPADQLGGFASASFDVVVLNSVVQYFPTVGYLVDVLSQAVRLVAPGGSIFIGDVRSLPLLETFHTSVQLYKADDTLTTQQVRQRVQRSIAQEQELVLDPAFFAALHHHLPQISAVDTQLKRGRDHNEMTCFRYDVTLRIGSAPAAPVAPEWRDWQAEQMTIARLREELAATPEMLAFTRVSNARLQRDAEAVRLLAELAQPRSVGDLRAQLAEQSRAAAIDPEDLWAISTELPYTIDLCWSTDGGTGCYDLLLQRTPTPARVHAAASAFADAPQPWSAYANDPLQAKLAQQLVPELQGYLRQRLPDYMVPSAFVVLTQIPLTTNGKLDRQLLPVPLMLENDSKAIVAPRTPAEHLLAGIWQQILRIEQVGIHHNFFELGGDSIISLQIISRVRQAGLHVTPQQMFQYQTIFELAQVATSEPARVDPPLATPQVARSPARGVTPADFPLAHISQPQLDQLVAARGPIEDIYPLGPAQGHMLETYIAAPVPGLYLIYEAFVIKQLHPAAFQRAWQQLIDRHPVLRTSFAWRGLDQPLQVVHPNVPIAIEYQDWREFSPAEQDTRLLAHIELVRQAGFNLEKAPFTRLTMFQISEESYKFFWGFNYMLQEGWSLPLLVQDLFNCYEAACQDTRVDQPPARPYRDYIAYHQQIDMAEAEAFWRATLKGFKHPTPLVSRMPGNQPVSGTRYANQQLVFSLAEGATIRALARQHQLTLNTVIQGAWALLVSHYTGERDIVFGCAVSGRSVDLAGIEEMIGLFNNFLPMRVETSPDAPLLEWLKDFQARQIEQRRYEYTPLVKIKEWSEIPAEQPLFEAYLTFENFPLDPALVARSAQLLRSIAGITQTEHALRVTVWAVNEILLAMSYYPRYFDDATVGRMLQDMYVLIMAMVAQPQQRLGALMQQFVTAKTR